MRLVDADKLLEAFSNSEHIIETTSGLEVMEMLAIKEVIDNAETYNQVGHKMATAEGFITNPEWHSDFKAGYKQAILDGQTNFKRPQGEWIYGEDDCGQDGWFCSECGFFVPWYYQYYEKDINFIRDYKACPHCLAEIVTYTGKDRDMRGEKND